MMDHFFSIIRDSFGEPIQIPATSVNQLVTFTFFLLVIYLIGLIVRRARLRTSRRSIPIVIGGWGTRGKSGTERKKAALFQELGINLLSKTTGCEAMVIHAEPGIDTIEIPIYRPGNKAGIWEQEKVVKWASCFQSDMFLWECMAVSSDYASILQNEWMQDDLSTLSNAFVDHENVQGPTGMDVARSLAAFTPARKILFTAEESMLPIIEQQGQRRGTQIIPLQWYESELVADDILALFPYRVHPRNLGLVLKLAASLGIDRDFALKAISQNIVPDLGAFKCFSTQIDDRKIEFWNGMSANDRISCISNWELAGFDHVQAEDYIVTVINNRDDRIARSHEFSELIATRLRAHLHILIGSNLEGMLGYIDEALDRYFEQLSFESAQNESWHETRQRIHNLIAGYFEYYRIDGQTPDAICKKLDRMIGPQDSPKKSALFIDKILNVDQADSNTIKNMLETEYGLPTRTSASVAMQLKRDLDDFRSIHEFEAYFNEEFSEAPKEMRHISRLEERFRSLIKRLIMNHIDVIWDQYASGDQIMRRLIDQVPPNLNSRVMGLQNIKGTGLDFAYRWVSLAKIQSMLIELENGSPDVQRMLLADFHSYKDYGIIDAPLAVQSLTVLKSRFSDDRGLLLTEAIETAKKAHERCLGNLKGPRRNHIWQYLMKVVENFWDATDSKKRKRKADRVMQDLFDRRISHARAASILHELGRRQDGGWLASGRPRSHV